MGHQRLNNLSLMAIEHEVMAGICSDDFIRDFAGRKARKVIDCYLDIILEKTQQILHLPSQTMQTILDGTCSQLLRIIINLKNEIIKYYDPMGERKAFIASVEKHWRSFIEQRKRQDTLPAEAFKVAVCHNEERRKMAGIVGFLHLSAIWMNFLESAAPAVNDSTDLILN
ncbi:hypothetical protein CAPTEDRAFT_216181 [Capitella teleta]|uniref:Uncharacterized protein n=1 Tax=Capitella teleta TaxID=283909 RepID=R7U7N2_CAPTE|nr:hypothetical protein CAPTEDRAFT_216181 [Capitella teleta]|eukprot:ELU01949.1 hypothetical protein CAPTEDRAFT_216181 [Capitella teleta]